MAEVEKLDELFPSRSTVKAHRRRTSKTSGHSGHSGHRSQTPLVSASGDRAQLGSSSKSSSDGQRSRGFLGFGSKKAKYVGHKPSEDESRNSSSIARQNSRSTANRPSLSTQARSIASGSSSAKEASPSDSWEPPPLFQAYPQSIKFSMLQASSLEADAILRYEDVKRRQRDLEITLAHADKKDTKALKKHARKPSGSLSKGTWIPKVYVLVTSGCLLQYSADGPYDRFPEKILKLGEDSVAFVSDAIPGKCFVLQVSQHANEDGVVPVEEAKSSIRSKLTSRKGDVTKAQSLLLVFDNAEEMGVWMKAIRKEIENMGGSRYTNPDIATLEAEAEMRKVETSHRYMIHQDPNQFADDLPSEVVTTPPTPNTLASFKQFESAAPTPTMRPQSETPSVSMTVISHDQVQLDQLRDSARFSHLSSGTMTVPTSRCSSPSSPQVESATSPESGSNWPSEKQSTSTLAERRRTMNLSLGNTEKDGRHSPLSLQLFPKPPQRPHSTFSIPDPPALSPSTPNYSLPNPNNRFSICYMSNESPMQRQPSYQSEQTASPGEVSSRPTSTIGELPLKENLSRFKHSRFRDGLMSDSVAEPEGRQDSDLPTTAALSPPSTIPAKVASYMDGHRPMSPEDFYPSKLANVQSLNPPGSVMSVVSPTNEKKRTPRSRSSSAADRRPWPSVLSGEAPQTTTKQTLERYGSISKSHSRPSSRSSNTNPAPAEHSSRPTSPYSLQSPAPFLSVDDLSSTLPSPPCSPPPYSPAESPLRHRRAESDSVTQQLDSSSKAFSPSPSPAINGSTPAIPPRSPRRPVSSLFFARATPSTEQKVLRSGSAMGFTSSTHHTSMGGVAAVVGGNSVRIKPGKYRKASAPLPAIAGPPLAPPPSCPLPPLPPGADAARPLSP